MKVPFIAQLMKRVPRTLLERQVLALRVCSRCHSRTLEEASGAGSERCLQCSKCLTLYVAGEPASGQQEDIDQ